MCGPAAAAAAAAALLEPVPPGPAPVLPGPAPLAPVAPGPTALPPGPVAVPPGPVVVPGPRLEFPWGAGACPFTGFWRPVSTVPVHGPAPTLSQDAGCGAIS